MHPEKQVHFLLLCSVCLNLVHGYDVLMVIGGMKIENGVTYVHKAVEVIGIASVCQIRPLPYPRHSLFAGRLRDRVMACGGHDGLYERWECFAYFPRIANWRRMRVSLNEPLIFGAAASDGQDNFYVAGGRSYSHEDRGWKYSDVVRVFNTRDNRWRTLAPLPSPMADACLVAVSNKLIFSGGSKRRYIYADEPSKVWTLDVTNSSSGWRDDILPPLLGSRMWHGCCLANIDDEISLLVAGGYYNGRATMSLPITDFILGLPHRGGEQWDYLGSLPEERKWGPALGLVAGISTISTAKNYGDNTVDELQQGSGHWQRDLRRKLRFNREYSGAVSVPHRWMPSYCGF